MIPATLHVSKPILTIVNNGGIKVIIDDVILKGTRGYGHDSDEGDNHAEDDDQCSDGDYGNEP